ncbi:MAG: metal-dependent transcriptional regulator [Candidatus Omnitrophica bacterium]|nr:metal-dependent transcriptional regulator [Candidatus Omnitrophota bacterium]
MKIVKNKKQVTPIMEDYLEVIGQLLEDDGQARVSQISKKLGVSKPTVSETLGKLKKLNLIKKSPYSQVELTERGREIAIQTQSKHDVLIAFLKDVLAVNQQIAESEACRIEHNLSRQTVEKLTKFINFFATDKAIKNKWFKVLESAKTVLEVKNV